MEEITIPKENWWKPLYIFLKTIFADEYKEAANSFMFMGAYKDGSNIIYEYKHGVTRKYLAVSDIGAPYKFDGDTYKPTSYDEAMTRVYADIEKFYGVDSKDKYFLKYSDYKKVRDEKLAELGYNTVTINPSDEKDIRDKIKNIRK